jgi:ABC-2 type transport system permease protein
VLLATYSLWRRDVLRFLRQRSRIVGALATPIVFWAVLGSGLDRSFQGADGAGYLAYFLPGSLALVALFTAVFSTISVIEDRQEGFLQGVLAAPVPRVAIVAGKMLGGVTLSLVNCAGLLLVAAVAGQPTSLAGTLAALGVLAVLAFGLTGLGLLIAWPMHSTQGFHAVMNLVLVPLWMLSGALFPASGAAGWVQAMMAANPLSYGVDAVRGALAGGPPAAIGADLAVLAAFAAAVAALATILVSRPMRT